MSSTLSQCLWQRRCNKFNTSRSTLSNKFNRQVYGDPFFLNRMVLEYSLQAPTADMPSTLCWSAQGDRLLSGSCSGQLYIWNPFDSNHQPSAVLSAGDKSSIQSANYLTQNRAICGSETGPIWIFDLDSGTPIETYACSKASTRLDIHGHNATQVTSCSEDGIVRQFDLRERHVCDKESGCSTNIALDYSHAATIKGDPVRLQNISTDPFAPHYLAVAGSQHCIYLHDLRMQGASLVRLFVNKNGMSDTSASQNELCYANVCKFSTTDSGSLLVNWSDDDLYLFNIHDDGMTTATLSQGSNHVVVDVVQRRLRYTGHLNPWVTEECIGFYGLDEEYIVSGTDDSMVFIWNRHNEKVVQMFSVGQGPITSVKGHPTLPIMAVAGSYGTIQLYTPRSEPSLTSPSTHPFAETSYASISHMFEADSLIKRNEQLKRGNPCHLFNHLILSDNDPTPCHIQ